jgi:hypothetical protein
MKYLVLTTTMAFGPASKLRASLFDRAVRRAGHAVLELLDRRRARNDIG